METGRTSALSSVKDIEVLVDADSHVTESLDQLLSYMNERHRGIKQLMARMDKPGYIFSIANPSPGFIAFQEDDHFGGDDPAEKLDHMNEFGIDYAIIDPTLSSHLNTVNNSRFAVALSEAYNSFILDTYADRDDRFRVTMSIAPHKPAKAAEEIDERADEQGVVAVHFPPSGLTPPMGHERYYPIYEAAQDNDLPILMHAVIGGSHLSFPVQHRWSETYALEHAIFHPFQQMWNFASLVFEGVPEFFPDLDFVFQETGIGWVPYMTWRLDDHYMDMSHEVPALEKLPSEYIYDRFHFTSQPLGMTSRNNKHLPMAIEMVGPDSVMFSSDIPHPDFDPPDELFERIHPYFDDETVRGIMGENAAELFDLGL